MTRYVLPETSDKYHLAPAAETRAAGELVASACSVGRGILADAIPAGRDLCSTCARIQAARQRRPSGPARREWDERVVETAPPSAPGTVTCPGCGKTSASRVLASCWNCGLDLELTWRAFEREQRKARMQVIA